MKEKGTKKIEPAYEKQVREAGAFFLSSFQMPQQRHKKRSEIVAGENVTHAHRAHHHRDHSKHRHHKHEDFYHCQTCNQSGRRCKCGEKKKWECRSCKCNSSSSSTCTTSSSSTSWECKKCKCSSSSSSSDSCGCDCHSSSCSTSSSSSCGCGCHSSSSSTSCGCSSSSSSTSCGCSSSSSSTSCGCSSSSSSSSSSKCCKPRKCNIKKWWKSPCRSCSDKGKGHYCLKCSLSSEECKCNDRHQWVCSKCRQKKCTCGKKAKEAKARDGKARNGKRHDEDIEFMVSQVPKDRSPIGYRVDNDWVYAIAAKGGIAKVLRTMHLYVGKTYYFHVDHNGTGEGGFYFSHDPIGSHYNVPVEYRPQPLPGTSAPVSSGTLVLEVTKDFPPYFFYGNTMGALNGGPVVVHGLN